MKKPAPGVKDQGSSTLKERLSQWNNIIGYIPQEKHEMNISGSFSVKEVEKLLL